MRNLETMWQFETAQFLVTAKIAEDDSADLSWADDEERAKIDSGEYTVFGTIVSVWFEGEKVGEDSLWGSVYSDPREFFEGHRDRDPMNRNCSLMRKIKGDNVVICHYFPDMVRIAIGNAREHLAKLRAVQLRH